MKSGTRTDPSGRRLPSSVATWLTYLHDMGCLGLEGKAIRSMSVPTENEDLMAESLDVVRDDLGKCKRCPLWRTRTNIVFGEGDPQSDLMFVGEAPGRDEDSQGRPFVGRAGQLLTRIIEAIDMNRGTVYIANILKCRPPGNRDPESPEVETCFPFLLRQIRSVEPKIICALGAHAARTLLDTQAPISRIRGRFHTVNSILIMPTFHPSYLLRNPGAKKDVWEDMQQVRDTLKELEAGHGR